MNEVAKIENNDIMSKFEKTDNILNDVQNIIEVSQKEAYHAVNTILSQRNWLIGMEKVMTEVIYIITCGFIRLFQRLSTQHVDNQISGFRGRIIEPYYKYMMSRHVNGMRRKHMSRLGVCVLYREI